jgi:hypothetical protein
MDDFSSVGHIRHDSLDDCRDNRLAHLASRDLDTLFSTIRAHASLGSGRAPPPTSLPRYGADSMSTWQSFHYGVSAKVADWANSLAAVGEYRRAVEAPNSNSIARGRGVHGEFSRSHPQDDDVLVDVLPDPLYLTHIELLASKLI